MKKMPQLFIYSAVITSIGLSSTLYFLSPPSHPSIYLPKGDIYDLAKELGPAFEDQYLSYDIYFKNIGKETLKINGIKPSCSCTAVSCENKVLEKDESSKLHIKFWPPAAGSSDEILSILLETNDPKNPRIMLQLKVFVKRTVVWNPASVSFKAKQGEQKYMDIRLKTFIENQSLNIDKIETSSDKIDVSCRESSDIRICRISLNPNCPKGIWSEKVTLSTSAGDAKKNVLIPVYLLIE